MTHHAWRVKPIADTSYAVEADDPEARTLSMTVAGFGGDADLHMMFNMFWNPLEF